MDPTTATPRRSLNVNRDQKLKMALVIVEKKLQSTLRSLEHKLSTQLLHVMYIQEKAQVDRRDYLQHKLMNWNGLFAPPGK
ncbi:hypothetical protein K3495_g10300 [Podosphaera aphanis]|nr:hypothetical protein K3495_g10300 [Podosphaera aphanis]